MVEYENIILVPRGRAPFGQHQKLQPPGWPLGRSNTGISWFPQFLSLCACPRSTLTNLIGWEYETITLHALTLAVSGKRQTSDATERNEQCKRKIDAISQGTEKNRKCAQMRQIYGKQTGLCGNFARRIRCCVLGTFAHYIARWETNFQALRLK